MIHGAKKLKIAFMNQNYIFSVQGSTEAYYIYKFLKDNHTLLPLVGNPKKDNVSCPSNTKVVLPKRKLPYSIWFNIVSLFFLFNNRHKYDYVYAYKDSLFSAIWLKLFNKKIICDFQTEPVEQDIEFNKFKNNNKKIKYISSLIKKYIYKVLIPKCNLVVTISNEVKKTLIDTYNAKSSDVYVQILGVDLKKFKSQKNKNFEKNVIRLINITSIGPMRRLEVDLKAVSILRKQCIPVYLTIVGRGDEMYIQNLKLICRQMEISEYVEWKGFVPHHLIPNLLDEHDIGLSSFPDLRAYQVASVSKVFEYLAMELVVVASDVVSNRKLVQHEYNGLLFQPSDGNSLALQIQRLWENPQLYECLKNNTRKSVEIYDWQKMLPDLMRKIQAI